MNKKEINKLLKDKKFNKLVNEIKRHAKDINKQQKQFDKTFEKEESSELESYYMSNPPSFVIKF